ncbi:folate-binding protein [Iodidimonas sp. SYSU 1G8]|uniref:CAF17-like 4Fe-4S cluster assembly/insertion protein YgfZ n=1 Tax=Iodidimonas sp. SYSU 1G8 TaxID=3133967 RepID=UPI0031FEBEA7
MKTAVILEERGVLAIGGSQRRSFLQGLISNDVERIAPSQAIYAALLTPQGKFLFDFFIAEQGETLLLDVDRERLPDLLKRLTMYKLRSDVSLSDQSADWYVASLLDPPENFGDTLGTAAALSDGVAFIDPRSARLGARALLPRSIALETLGYRTAPFETYEARRVSLGIPDTRRDLEADKTLLLEANFDQLNGVSFNKGCYVGQELTARTKYRGNVRRKLYPVVLDGVAAPGTEVMLGDREAGALRSVAGDRAIALLRIEDVDKARESGTPLMAGGTTIQVETPVP